MQQSPVEPQNQQRVVDILEATRQVMQHVPGYVSASIHKSQDGERVANYAQWENQEKFEAMFHDPSVKEHMDELLKISTADPHLYELLSTGR
jgi:antibiotic biosynthesis monooxygenase (ABM) superfamily enzyme